MEGHTQTSPLDSPDSDVDYKHAPVNHSSGIVRRYFNLTDQDSIRQKDMINLATFIEKCHLLAPIDINEDGKLDFLCE